MVRVVVVVSDPAARENGCRCRNRHRSGAGRKAKKTDYEYDYDNDNEEDEDGSQQAAAQRTRYRAPVSRGVTHRKMIDRNGMRWETAESFAAESCGEDWIGNGSAVNDSAVVSGCLAGCRPGTDPRYRVTTGW